MKNFTQLYKENFNFVLFFIYKMVHDHNIAKELTQIVFIKAYEKIDNYDSSKSNFKTWLLNIARNTVFDENRRACNRLIISINNSPSNPEINPEETEDYSQFHQIICSDESNPENITEKKEIIKNIVKYLRTLPILKRRIGLYRFLYDKALYEISEELNIPLGTVKVYTKQIKESLQLQLA